jgi:hypothetical protein
MCAEKYELDLFVKDALRNLIDSPSPNIQTIKERLLLLGWKEEYIDYVTIQLIQACFSDD